MQLGRDRRCVAWTRGAVACLGSSSVGRGHGTKRRLSRHAPPVVAGWRSCLPGPCLVLRRLESVRMCRVFRSLGGRVGPHRRQSTLARGHDGPDVRWQAGFTSSADALWSVGRGQVAGLSGSADHCRRWRPDLQQGPPPTGILVGPGRFGHNACQWGRAIRAEVWSAHRQYCLCHTFNGAACACAEC